jgi:hypothetical protein
MKTFPAQRDNWFKYTRLSRIFTILQIIALSGLFGFTFLIGGIFHFWDEEKLHGSYNSRSVEDYEAQYKGKEYHLLQNLPAFSKEIPTVEMSGGLNGYRAGWYFGWGGENRPGHHYTNTWPNLFMGCLGLFLFTYSVLGSCQCPPKMRHWPILWCHISASLGICAAALLSLFVLWAFSDLSYLSSARSGAIERGYYCEADIDTVTKAIEKWAGQNGFAMGDQMDWHLNTVPKGERVAQARLREARKPSPFDQWRSTWTSFRRVSPLLTFELVGSEKPAETHVYVTGIMDCTPEQAANGTCHLIPENLLAMFETLRSAQTGSTTNKTNLPDK